MTNTPRSARRWRIGTLAEASGVTVRTLYYYDEIGLVSASTRTASGHRRYTDADIRRLYRVLALRQLGLSLDEIATVLSGTTLSGTTPSGTTDDLTGLRDLLDAQLADLDASASRIAELSGKVRGLLTELNGPAMPEAERFLTALETTVPLVEARTAFTPEQRRALDQRAAELGGDAVAALKAELFELLPRLRQHATDATPVDDPAVQRLVARWQRVGAAFKTGDAPMDTQVETAAAALWRSRHPTISRRLSERIAGLEPNDLADVVAYVQRARTIGEQTTTGDPDDGS